MRYPVIRCELVLFSCRFLVPSACSHQTRTSPQLWSPRALLCEQHWGWKSPSPKLGCSCSSSSSEFLLFLFTSIRPVGLNPRYLSFTTQRFSFLLFSFFFKIRVAPPASSSSVLSAHIFVSFLRCYKGKKIILCANHRWSQNVW